MAQDIKPYKIQVPDPALAKLKAKLAASTLPDAVDFSDDWNYGSPRSDVARLAKYWEQGFDWRKQEEGLNQYPQFTTVVDVEGFGGLNIHFLHQRSADPKSIPLLFVHGCE